MLRRRLVTIVTADILAGSLVTGAFVQQPENPGCVGQAVSRAATNGYRSTEGDGWHVTAQADGMRPDQWGVQWIRSHCGLANGNAGR